MEKNREELKAMLKARIGEKKIQRSSKEKKENILEKTLKDIGIDKEKFKNDLEAIKKQGGLQISLE